ncbi:MAG: hypothetical protein P1U46_04805, partial [Patescibacteria group bacterium]|nr:hypothetical protein [Patescibacteria group bacterium]
SNIFDNLYLYLSGVIIFNKFTHSSYKSKYFIIHSYVFKSNSSYIYLYSHSLYEYDEFKSLP